MICCESLDIATLTHVYYIYKDTHTYTHTYALTHIYAHTFTYKQWNHIHTEFMITVRCQTFPAKLTICPAKINLARQNMYIINGEVIEFTNDKWMSGQFLVLIISTGCTHARTHVYAHIHTYTHTHGFILLIHTNFWGTWLSQMKCWLQKLSLEIIQRFFSIRNLRDWPLWKWIAENYWKCLICEI